MAKCSLVPIIVAPLVLLGVTMLWQPLWLGPGVMLALPWAGKKDVEIEIMNWELVPDYTAGDRVSAGERFQSKLKR